MRLCIVREIAYMEMPSTGRRKRANAVSGQRSWRVVRDGARTVRRRAILHGNGGRSHCSGLGNFAAASGTAVRRGFAERCAHLLDKSVRTAIAVGRSRRGSPAAGAIAVRPR